jgi:hypothetical protein
MAAASIWPRPGPYTLIFDSEIPGEWDGLAAERDFIIERVNALNL